MYIRLAPLITLLDERKLVVYAQSATWNLSFGAAALVTKAYAWDTRSVSIMGGCRFYPMLQEPSTLLMNATRCGYELPSLASLNHINEGIRLTELLSASDEGCTR